MRSMDYIGTNQFYSLLLPLVPEILHFMHFQNGRQWSSWIQRSRWS